jgi:hypothetical protein
LLDRFLQEKDANGIDGGLGPKPAIWSKKMSAFELGSNAGHALHDAAHRTAAKTRFSEATRRHPEADRAAIGLLSAALGAAVAVPSSSSVIMG